MILGVKNVSRTMVANIMQAGGFGRDGPGRKDTWDSFIRAHAETLWACDFFSRKVWTRRGLVEHFVLFFINVASRRVIVSTSTADTDAAWVGEQARRFVAEAATIECLPPPRLLLRDNDRKFATSFETGLRMGVPRRIACRSARRTSTRTLRGKL